jgi:hypothetical protein
LVDGQRVQRGPSAFGTPSGDFLQVSANASLDPGITGASAKIAIGDNTSIDDWGAERMAYADLAVVLQEDARQSAGYR